MKIMFGEHAESMLVERNLERTWVELTLREPDWTEPDPKHPERLRAFRVIPERGERVLRVVYVPGEKSCRIVTLFLDRGRKR